MRITASQLRRIIKEEVQTVLNEDSDPYEGQGIVSQLGRLTQDVYRISNASSLEDRHKEAKYIADELGKMAKELKALLTKKKV